MRQETALTVAAKHALMAIIFRNILRTNASVMKVSVHRVYKFAWITPALTVTHQFNTVLGARQKTVCSTSALLANTHSHLTLLAVSACVEEFRPAIFLQPATAKVAKIATPLCPFALNAIQA